MRTLHYKDFDWYDLPTGSDGVIRRYVFEHCKFRRSCNGYIFLDCVFDECKGAENLSHKINCIITGD